MGLVGGTGGQTGRQGIVQCSSKGSSEELVCLLQRCLRSTGRPAVSWRPSGKGSAPSTRMNWRGLSPPRGASRRRWAHTHMHTHRHTHPHPHTHTHTHAHEPTAPLHPTPHPYFHIAPLHPTPHPYFHIHPTLI